MSDSNFLLVHLTSLFVRNISHLQGDTEVYKNIHIDLINSLDLLADLKIKKTRLMSTTVPLDQALGP
jgi:hypothetical protein